jgi:DNA-binding MarR family transcriptional regulator
MRDFTEISGILLCNSAEPACVLSAASEPRLRGSRQTVSLQKVRVQNILMSNGRRTTLELPDYQEEILRSLRRIMRAVDLYSRRLVTDHGLSGPQLLCLRQLDSRGDSLSGQLANALSLSPATVCGILDRLEARGLVSRERQTDDKRRVLVRLTAKGRRTLRRAPPPLEHGFLKQLEAMPLGQQAEIDASLKQLVSMMSADTLDAAPLLTDAAILTSDPKTRGPGRSMQ